MKPTLVMGAIAALTALPGPLHAQGVPVPADMDAVRFMEGCWRVAQGAGRFMHERCGPRTANVMLGATHDDEMVTFEAPEHDYPRRIRYRRLDPERLEARIDGGANDPEPRVWVMARVPCVG